VKRILIIDDDLFVANTCYNQLMAEGYFVKSAADGESGMDLMREFKPNLILLDLILPKMSGLDIIKHVRSDEEFNKIPIIVFTNAFESDMVQEAWKAGATKCIAKANYSPKELIIIVHRAIDDSVHDQNVAAPFGAPVSSPNKAASDNSGIQTDQAIQAGLRKTYLDKQPATIVLLRASLQNLIKAVGETDRLRELFELYRRVHTLAGNAGIAGMVGVAHLASALEALLKELHEKPENINSSTLRTIATAVDLLSPLVQHGEAHDDEEALTARILVVDDEEISRRAIIYSLEKGGLSSVNVDSGEAAYELLTKNPYDLIFLDVLMPGMSGIELCTMLRALPAHKKTPVVFVTSLTDFNNRTSSTIAGGNDFIAKPFLFIELTVKALIYVLRGKLTPAK
jgi:CheY-like chemotaxis protein